ncbi:N-6 DNA methylase [Candidatus Poribacteria bacterium]|nr:N-6 DNA methylase [Candidatus Poribacteria bacterium]
MAHQNQPNPIENRALFSDYYLQSLIMEQPQWTDTPDMESVCAEITALYDAVKANAEKWNEAQTEREFIQPVLELLGHAFEVQPSLQTSLGTKRPDYAFFGSNDVLNDAQAHLNTNPLFKTAFAIGDAKAWSRDLDRKAKGKGDPFDNANPSYQIDFYLRQTDKLWGILTNGRQWRLYHRQTSYRLDCFYQVDLSVILSEALNPPHPPLQRGAGGISPFRYFYCLFRRDAFLPDATGQCFLDAVLAGSQQHTVGVSADLKERVYEALRLLIGGFLDYQRNGFDRENPPLDEIHTNCLILLYRILFILYAESRGLLPVENPDYAAHYSLASLATEIHERLDGGGLIIPAMSDYWARLRGLFGLINDGWRDLIPQYNGGLFHPARHLFLEKYDLGNDVLARAVELLTRTEKGERIVYRDLEVRHLGSIYEGLLEYKPKLATEDMVIVSQKQGETVEPKAKGSNRAPDYPAGAVYLLTDKGERKATGSYYTPDYIVRYIVESTLAPLCQGKSVDEILALKILDPATGSGHFLVGVVDYLAEELVTHPEAPTLADDSDREIAHWRRRVVESCVYGVDMNPMAVELAKLSLWLHTVARGEPLSFLDHHIRCGNSLIGGEICDLAHQSQPTKSRRQEEPVQMEIPMEFPFTTTVARAIGHYQLIEAMGSRTADDIHAKEHELDIAQQMLRYHKGVANLWTSVYFGNDVSRAEYHAALDALRSNTPSAIEAMQCYQRAQEIAAQKRFFHWEIEFPEVFRDKYGRELENPGFSAVVGNPPYANAWGMTNIAPQDRAAIDQLCNTLDLLKGHWDLYAAFIIKSLELLREGGYHAFIVPDALAREKYADRLREFLLKKTQLLALLHFEGMNVFVDVSRHCFIYVLKFEPPHPQMETRLFMPSTNSGPEKQIGQINQAEWLSSDNFQIRLELVNPMVRALGRKVWDASIRLGQFCYVMVGATTHSKDKKSFIKATITSKQKVGNAKRFFDGKNLSRYEINWDDRYIDYRQDEMYGPRVPELFESPKVLVRKRTTLNEQLVVSYDEDKYYCDDTVIAVTYYENVDQARAQTEFEGYERIKPPYPTLLYLTGIIASQLLTWVFRHFFASGTLQGSYSDVYPQQVRAFPIRRINFTTPADERERLREKGITLYDLCLSKGDIDCVLGFVKGHLNAEPERSDVVHDLLAFLAEKMIEMHKAKGEEIRGFLRWLEREIDADIGSLKNTTALQNYHDLTLNELIGVLKQNHRALGVDPSARGFQERLEREFRASVAKIQPLLSCIQRTDALIDQVAYQLYGLTAGGMGRRASRLAFPRRAWERDKSNMSARRGFGNPRRAFSG